MFPPVPIGESSLSRGSKNNSSSGTQQVYNQYRTWMMRPPMPPPTIRGYPDFEMFKPQHPTNEEIMNNVYQMREDHNKVMKCIVDLKDFVLQMRAVKKRKRHYKDHIEH
jgi:hypothetical protein